MRVAIGDFITIWTGRGMALLQFVFKDHLDIPHIRVLPGFYSKELFDPTDLVNQTECFTVGFPVAAAQRRGIIEFVGRCPVPSDFTRPQYSRDVHFIDDEFLGWHIIENETLKTRLVKRLSPKERTFPPAGLWNDTLLIERLDKGWSLESWADYPRS